MAVLLGVLVAIAFGSADFVGGRASMRASTVAVLLVSHALGVAGAIVLVLAVSAQIEPHDVVFGALAGTATVVGLGLLYQGLATAAMGVVAPITAVVGAIVPITYGVARGERPSVFTAIGILLAVGAGGLIAREAPGGAGTRTTKLAPGIVIAIAAGVVLGSSLVLFSRTSEDSGMFPVLFGRGAGLIIAAIGAVWLMTRSQITFPRGQALRFALCAGVLDVLATALSLLAVRRGSISVVVGLAALVPGFTVLWAFVVLHEDLRRDQRVAILVALVGLVLVAAG